MQHPRGEKKQVALRENRIVDIPDRFLHYAADTEPGSSGSPVFNDQWEVVALHHASVPLTGKDEFANEGIRISRVCRFVREAELGPAQRELADQIFAPPPPAPEQAPPLPQPAGEYTVTVPVEITVRLGSPSARGDTAVAPAPAVPNAVTIDPD